MKFRGCVFTGDLFMERLAGENLPESESLICGPNLSLRRVRMKKVSLFSVKPAGDGTRFRTKQDFFSCSRMNTLFARQAAFEKWGSKNERD